MRLGPMGLCERNFLKSPVMPVIRTWHFGHMNRWTAKRTPESHIKRILHHNTRSNLNMLNCRCRIYELFLQQNCRRIDQNLDKLIMSSFSRIYRPFQMRAWSCITSYPLRGLPYPAYDIVNPAMVNSMMLRSSMHAFEKVYCIQNIFG